MELAIKTPAQFTKAIEKAGTKSAEMKLAWHNLFMYSIHQALMNGNYKDMGEFVKTMSNGTGKELMLAHIRNFTDVSIVRGEDKKTVVGSKKNKTAKINPALVGKTTEQLLEWYNSNPYYTTSVEAEVEDAKPIDFMKAFATFNKRITAALKAGMLNNIDAQTREAYLHFAKLVDEKTNSLGKLEEARKEKEVDVVAGAKAGNVQRKEKPNAKVVVKELQAA